MKNKSEITREKAITSFTLPCHGKKEINLFLLYAKTKEKTIFKLKSELETCPSHICISIENADAYFNIYSTGKLVVFHKMKIKALHYLIDFVYYYLIEDCLNEG